MTDLRSKQMEKDIVERTQAITLLERQIVSKTDDQFSSANLSSLDEFPKDKKKKFTLERSASDKHIVSKSPTKHFFRCVYVKCMVLFLFKVNSSTLRSD